MRLLIPIALVGLTALTVEIKIKLVSLEDLEIELIKSIVPNMLFSIAADILSSINGTCL